MSSETPSGSGDEPKVQNVHQSPINRLVSLALLVVLLAPIVMAAYNPARSAGHGFDHPLHNIIEHIKDGWYRLTSGTLMDTSKLSH